MRLIAHLRAGLIAVALSAALIAAPDARAQFVPGGYHVGSQQFNLTQGTFNAGAFTGTWNSTPIIFWCIELTQTFSFGPQNTTWTPSVASNTLLSKLFSAAYAGALGTTQNSAAFQLAIWEIIYDGSNLNLSGGGFKVLNDNDPSNDNTVVTAQGYLNSVLAAPASFSLIFLTNPGHQDFVTANLIPTTTKVPEPGSLALIAIALVAGGFVRARNARAAA